MYYKAFWQSYKLSHSVLYLSVQRISVPRAINLAPFISSKFTANIFCVHAKKKVQLNLCGQERKHSDRYFFCLFLFTESWWACSADLNSLSICLCVCLIISLYPGGFWSVALLESLSHQRFFYFFFLLIYLQYNCDVFETIWLIREGEVKCC